jgi:hypothetical protein
MSWFTSKEKKESLAYLIEWCNNRVRSLPKLEELYPKEDDDEEYIARAYIFTTRTRQSPMVREYKIRGIRRAYLMSRKLAYELDVETKDSPKYSEYGIDFQCVKVKKDENESKEL